MTAMADDRGNPFQAVEMVELCAEHEQQRVYCVL